MIENIKNTIDIIRNLQIPEYVPGIAAIVGALPGLIRGTQLRLRGADIQDWHTAMKNVLLADLITPVVGFGICDDKMLGISLLGMFSGYLIGGMIGFESVESLN